MLRNAQNLNKRVKYQEQRNGRRRVDERAKVADGRYARRSIYEE